MPNALHHFVQARRENVRKKLFGNRLDGIIFSTMSNIRYLSGFTGSAGVFLLGAKDARLLVDGRYTAQAASEAAGIQVLQYQNQNQGIAEAVKALNLETVGFEAAAVSVAMHSDLRKKMKGVTLVPLGDELSGLRAVKDRREKALMKKAAAIASEAMARLAREMRPGWTERETALQLEWIARRAGAEQVSFETIVGSGEHGALPHAKPTNRRLRHGDFVVIDFGVKYRGYCSDETCTFTIGELTAAKKNAYRAVLRAHDEAIAFVRAGKTAADVDALVRSTLGEKYGRYFVHGTGHGVGLEVHEAPRLAPNSRDVLLAGMVVTVEPGIYYPGRWGIRIEDTVFVKENGCELLTGMSKKLIVIE
ncbi:MAG: Xaa-Pro peptidase family protein [Smithellaceae bacterium]|nr:aminopeptidase P family protein [Syntrophaceae bacterium]MDD4241625.1 Xaa-Pro peptidase family protein [Smithellaceae bacterium]NLX52286.1 aminopeptidase P family protein [Deltaproteobacteria bacterium]